MNAPSRCDAALAAACGRAVCWQPLRSTDWTTIFDRLGEDHDKAVTFADAVERAVAASTVPPETNIVMIDLAPGMVALDVARRAAEKGVLVSVWAPSRLRTVWHYDVSNADAASAGERVREALDEAWRDLADTSEWPVMPLDSASLQVPKVVGPPTPSGPRR